MPPLSPRGGVSPEGGAGTQCLHAQCFTTDLSRVRVLDLDRACRGAVGRVSAARCSRSKQSQNPKCLSPAPRTGSHSGVAQRLCNDASRSPRVAGARIEPLFVSRPVRGSQQLRAPALTSPHTSRRRGLSPPSLCALMDRRSAQRWRRHKGTPRCQPSDRRTAQQRD